MAEVAFMLLLPLSIVGVAIWLGKKIQQKYENRKNEDEMVEPYGDYPRNPKEG